MKKFSGIILFILVMVCGRDACADTVYLKNSRKIEGIVRNESDDSIELEVCSGSVTFKTSEIDKIIKSGLRDQSSMRADWERQRQASQERIEQQEEEEERQPKKVEITRDSPNITLFVQLNGRVDVQLVMDTGSTLVVLKKEVAEELNLKLDDDPEVRLVLADGRQTHAKLITLESVKVEGVEAKNVEAAIMLDEITDPGFKDGLLGMSFLKRFNFKVDNRENKLILEKL
ncbi:MAG: retropepsin-like aspartic protease [Candidatus Omnitrophota bacterium]